MQLALNDIMVLSEFFVSLFNDLSDVRRICTSRKSSTCEVSVKVVGYAHPCQ
jgi:hypothetical protein